jgi:endonuclease YncB( thermonuclease family)
MGKVAVTALMIFVALVIETPAADLISGVPHIVDGDTVAIGDTKIRLEGIA